MNRYLKLVLYGLLTWLIPFVVSVFFYGSNGQPAVDVFFFKTIMIIVGGAAGAFFLVRYFAGVNGGWLGEAVLVGFAWFVINFGMDIIVLLPMSGMSLPDYVTRIGLRYLMLPIMSIAIGMAVRQALPARP